MMLAKTIRCLYSQSEGRWLGKSHVVVVLSSYLDQVVRGRQIYTASKAVFRHRDTNQWSEMNRDLEMRVRGNWYVRQYIMRTGARIIQRKLQQRKELNHVSSCVQFPITVATVDSLGLLIIQV